VNNNNLRIILWFCVLTAPLVSCGGTRPAATRDFVQPAAPIELGTIVAQTAAAAQTQTATNLPSPTFTATPSVTPTEATPTATFYFSLLSPTSAVPIETSAADLNVEPNSLVAGTKTAPEDVKFSDQPWSCVGVGKYPPNYAVLPAGKQFIATWQVVNNGTKAWTANTIDFVYKSGYRNEGRLAQDLNRYVARGQRATLQVLFIAPKAPGEYSAIWTLEVGSHRFCGMIITFQIADNK